MGVDGLETGDDGEEVDEGGDGGEDQGPPEDGTEVELVEAFATELGEAVRHCGGCAGFKGGVRWEGFVERGDKGVFVGSV